jgi:glycosyltransferase involved in cell wall biosynthesis
MKIAFISGMSTSPWGGSEELWSRAALALKKLGHEVFAGVKAWEPVPEAAVNLSREGIGVQFYDRARPSSMMSRALRVAVRKLLPSAPADPQRSKFLSNLKRFNPDIVCVSHGAVACGIDFMEWCLDIGLPYVSISQNNSESLWPSDEFADRLRRAHAGAVATCFVSQANLDLFECQLGVRLPNARVVRNPFNVRYDAAPKWPGDQAPWRLACVARLAPHDKGQDLIIQAMADPSLRDEPVSVSLYGHGPAARTLQKLADTLQVAHKIHFRGYTDDVEAIWAEHHALFLPSRNEGLPLAIVEAMLCGRPVFTTEVAGNTEVVEDGVSGFVASAPKAKFVIQTMKRAWNNRAEWRAMGAAASSAVRLNVPPDPVAVFADLLIESAKSASTKP